MIDFLLNPNVAYMVLVAGFWLAMFALMAPGSGIFELAALVALVASGWFIYNLPVNWWALVLIIAGGAALVMAVLRASRRLYLVLSIATLILGSLYLFRGEGWAPAVHPLLAVIVSTGTALFFWWISLRILESGRVVPVQDPARLIGATGETQTVVHQEGTVQVMGELWTARSSQPIPAETKIRVVRRDGFVLIIEPIDGGGD